MSFRNDGKQVMQYAYDFDVDGGAISEIFLSAKANSRPVPTGAVITAVSMKVVTAFTSAGSATLAYGNDDDPDGYSGAALAVAALVDNLNANGWDNGAALLWDDTNDHPIHVSVNDAADGAFSISIATAAMTAGKAYFTVEYYFPSES